MKVISFQIIKVKYILGHTNKQGVQQVMQYLPK